ncbi:MULTISPECIES: hypothetical protein [unclassified Mycobacterium]|uniref:hypothetical protein n=1 Tax=unclassified Mycobacterium TaxID=2642494 RepID=UPI0029C7324A|nr:MULTISPECIES: hypothetical protein [unclassified Mycobacterium]
MVATAPLLDVGVHAPARVNTDGIVAVHNLGFGRSTASCSCGWAGRRRHLKAAAEQDAWEHSMRDGCDVSCPLVLAW